MTPRAAEILELKQRYMIPCLYHFYQDPPVLVRGQMQYLFDSDGRRYLDCYAGVTVVNCGHCNPVIVDAAVEQLRSLQHTTTIYLNECTYHLARDLVRFLDCGIDRVFFVNSGTEANEGALLLSRLHTGRSEFIALRGGLHGRTSLSMGLTGIPMWRTDPAPPPGLHFAPRPCCGECELGKTTELCDFACLEPVRQLLRTRPVAAVIAEPIQGNGGLVEPPEGYFARLRDIVHEAGALLIFDEVQCGFGRTGADFRFKGLDVEPDIVTMAKALGNGFPIGAFCCSTTVAESYTKPGASTTGGNPVSAAAARAVLRYFRDENLSERAAELGATLKRGLVTLTERHPFTGAVRGRGLMLGLPLERDGKPLPELTDWVLETLKDNGVLVGKTGPGRNVLTFMPPLVVNQDDLSHLTQVLSTILQQAPAETMDRET